MDDAQVRASWFETALTHLLTMRSAYAPREMHLSSTTLKAGITGHSPSKTGVNAL